MAASTWQMRDELWEAVRPLQTTAQPSSMKARCSYSSRSSSAAVSRPY
jgi:hypothetical protein